MRMEIVDRIGIMLIAETSLEREMLEREFSNEFPLLKQYVVGSIAHTPGEGIGKVIMRRITP